MEFYQNVNKTSVKQIIKLFNNLDSCELLLGRGSFGTVTWAPDNKIEFEGQVIDLVRKTMNGNQIYMKGEVIDEFLMEVLMTSKLTELRNECPFFPIIHNASICGDKKILSFKKFGNKYGTNLYDLYYWLETKYKITDEITDYITLSLLWGCNIMEQHGMQMIDVHSGNLSYEEIPSQYVTFGDFSFKSVFLIKFIDCSIGCFRGYCTHKAFKKLSQFNNITIIECVRTVYSIFCKGKITEMLFKKFRDQPPDAIRYKNISPKKNLIKECVEFCKKNDLDYLV